jgi:hypothetical protein
VVVGRHVLAERIERLVVIALLQVREFVHDDHLQEIRRRFPEQRRDMYLALRLQLRTLHA